MARTLLHAEEYMREVARIRNPSRAEFEERFVRTNTPVIITDAMNDWPALGRWSLEHLREKCGESKVEIEHYADEDRFKDWVTIEMTIAKYCDLLEGADYRKYYLAGYDMRTAFRAMLDEIKVPPFVDASRLKEVIAFIGVDSVSAYHYHQAVESVLCQVVGTKRLVLHPPSDTNKLYPYPWWRLRRYNFSQVSPDADDVGDRFPRFQSAQRLECEIHPGEMLFIPIQWWHVVYGSGLSMSVTHFWKTSLSAWKWRPPAPGIRDLANRSLTKGMFYLEKATRGRRIRDPIYDLAEALGIVDNAEFFKRQS